MSIVNTTTSQGLDLSVVPPRREVSRTVENWLQTVFWTAAGMVVCAIAYCVEKYGFRLKEQNLPRMFGNPAEIAMRIFGLPHFMVGLYFMLSAKRMRTVRAWGWFAALLAMGMGFALVFGRLGGHRNPVMLIAFYFYFLIHGFRDEAFFYKSSGDCPAPTSRPSVRVLLALQVMLISLIIAFLTPTYLLFVQMKKHGLPIDDPVLNMFFPASVPFLIKFACYLVPVLLINGLLYFWLERTYPGGWRSIWREHHPILMVFLWSTAIVMATLGVGPWTFNFVVLAHFVGWYLFAMRKLQTVPPAARATPHQPLAWMRTTRSGFNVLHLGLAVFVTGAIAVSTYVFKNGNWMDVVFGGPSFYYWTVLHVSLSFYPR